MISFSLQACPVEQGCLVRDLRSKSSRVDQRARPTSFYDCDYKNLKQKRFTSFTMSVLPPEVHAALASLLQGLSSPDNQIRTHAEEQLNNEWIAARPDVLLMGLVEQIQSAQEPSVWHLPSSLSLHTTHLADTVHINRHALSQQSSFVECQQRQGKRLGRRSQKSYSCYYSRPKRWP